MSDPDNCDNCGAATGNEPLRLCDYCASEPAIASAALLCDLTPVQRAAPELLAALAGILARLQNAASLTLTHRDREVLIALAAVAKAGAK